MLLLPRTASRIRLMLAGLCVATTTSNAQARNYPIIPRPVAIVAQRGQFEIRNTTVVHAPTAFTAVARRFARDIAPATGFDLAVRSTAAGASNVIVIRRDASIAPEGYAMSVGPGVVTIRASQPAGAFYAFETLKQLLPSAIYRSAPIAGTPWIAPAVRIDDEPRFSWRGMHLDVSRHFQSKEFVRKYIDLLARHKMNRFHWHLTDDQGWRIEIRKYPKLTEIGSCRDGTLVGPYVTDPAKRVVDGVKHCGYYTQDDIREIVAYAAERFITVVPEIEMPGHAQAAIAAYPELGVRTDTTVGVWGVWGVSEFIFNANPSTISFLQDVLTEIMALFPGKWIHVGGDEADKKQWKASPQIQARIKELGVKDEHELQSWFIRQMDAFLTARGRRLVGWNEILEGGLAENATVMSWQGMKGGIDAAQSGHDVVMAPTSHTYFDYLQSRDRAKEPPSFGGFLPLDTVYAFEPVPAALSPAQAKHILGAQAQIWTEYIKTSKHVEYMMFPRAAALSEVLWTAPQLRDFNDFMSRLQIHTTRLQALDVNFRPLDPR